MLQAHEHRRVALPVVQQPAGILHEALRVALVPVHCLGAEGLGLGKELDTQILRIVDNQCHVTEYMYDHWHPRAGPFFAYNIQLSPIMG